MPPTTIDDPFAEPRVPEVRLERGPLELVLFQVRFPGPVTRIEHAINAGEIAEALSAEYPFADRQEVMEFVVTPGHLPSAQKSANSVAAILSDPKQDWLLNVAKDAVSLTTTAYLHRDDLLERASTIFRALSGVAEPPAVSRVGLRYINRIQDVESIRTLCTNGGLAPPIRQQQEFVLSDEGIQSSISELQHAWLSGHRLHARWGLLAAGVSLANPLEALSNRSWVLDIDAIDETKFVFSPEEVVDRLKTLSERAYRFFRWFFTPTALAEFGGTND